MTPDAAIATALLSVLATVVGLAIGSFLNVVIYRVPRRLSVVSPPSACPTCEAQITARDNIPVLSWLLLRGRCRSCGARISRRYPIVEAVTAVLFLAVALRFAPVVATASTPMDAIASSLVLVAFLYLTAVSIALTAIDLELHRLPNAIVIPAYVVGAVLLLGAAILGGDIAAFLWALVGGAAMFAFYLLLALVYPGGMGMGDVKLAGVLGIFLAFLGWQELIVSVAAAFVLGGVVSVLLIAMKRADRKSGIPFGPWMLVGAWVGVYAGEYVADGYLALVGLN